MRSIRPSDTYVCWPSPFHFLLNIDEPPKPFFSREEELKMYRLPPPYCFTKQRERKNYPRTAEKINPFAHLSDQFSPQRMKVSSPDSHQTIKMRLIKDNTLLLWFSVVWRLRESDWMVRRWTVFSVVWLHAATQVVDEPRPVRSIRGWIIQWHGRSRCTGSFGQPICLLNNAAFSRLLLARLISWPTSQALLLFPLSYLTLLQILQFSVTF